MTYSRVEYLMAMAERVRKLRADTTGRAADMLADELEAMAERVESEIDDEIAATTDRDHPADAEWFAGLSGVVTTHQGKWLKWADDMDWLSIGCRVADGQFWLSGLPWRYTPTRGQVLSVMAGLGKKGDGT